MNIEARCCEIKQIGQGGGKKDEEEETALTECTLPSRVISRG